MNRVKYFLHRMRVEYEKFLFFRAITSILDTPIVQKGSMPYTLLSMVHHRDVLPYLAAMKSFVRYVNPRRIVVVCDPSITDIDRKLFQSHVPHIELRSAEEFVNSDVPRGGCWERLFAITEYAQTEYVIQLDADTLTIARPVEVESSINNIQGFVLGEAINQRVLPVQEISAIAGPKAALPNSHIQYRVEAALNTIGFDSGTKYVRGCAGFTGFRPDEDMRAKLLDFSRRMLGLFDHEWKSWGTEQVASNFIVANQDGTEVLPFPRYGMPNVSDAHDSFIHFIGAKRFNTSMYRKTALQIASELRNAN